MTPTMVNVKVTWLGEDSPSDKESFDKAVIPTKVSEFTDEKIRDILICTNLHWKDSFLVMDVEYMGESRAPFAFTATVLEVGVVGLTIRAFGEGSGKMLVCHQLAIDVLGLGLEKLPKKGDVFTVDADVTQNEKLFMASIQY